MRLVSLALLALTACNRAPSQVVNVTTKVTVSPASRDVTLRAKDGLTVFARAYAADQPKAVILLFHQAGSSKGEYATIAPKLALAGYDALAVDARAGGGLFG